MLISIKNQPCKNVFFCQLTTVETRYIVGYITTKRVNQCCLSAVIRDNYV